MSHRSGCQGEAVGCHAKTWGECARQGHIATQWLGGTGPSLGDQKAFQRETDRYGDAVRQGLDPESVSHYSVDKAYKAAEKE